MLRSGMVMSLDYGQDMKLGESPVIQSMKRGPNLVALCILPELVIPPVRMDLHLIDRRLDACKVLHLLGLLHAEVTDANGADQPLIHQLLKGLPGFLHAHVPGFPHAHAHGIVLCVIPLRKRTEARRCH